ncbi:hypothetical protein ID866_7151 [Astraeus odoratus]|nr:hypothetical protein ID866_7151 [Astraeus odoratus]
MFRSSTQPGPYDDLVAKATDENLTGEDWETILNLCDKVQDDGEQGARNAIAALLKRLAHRSPNVQLYALSLAESLSKNCGIALHRELASRVFTQGLERLVTDRTTHDKVRKRALSLIAMWTADFENDPSLGVMEECYNNLRAKSPAYPSGYVPAQSPTAAPAGAHGAASSTSSLPAQTSPAPAPASTPIVTRVRALHTFEATEPGELPFERGDIIRVVDRAYRDWWRGQLRGRTGIFPVNYVEPLPEPTAAELAREAEQEAAVFAQAANVDRLLTLLRGLDSSGERLADNEEIQELYRSCMSLRPKIVKLIDKYSQKRTDLIAMNEAFVKARTLFDRMMEESLARHTGGHVYPSSGPYPAQHGQYAPEATAGYAAQSYGGFPGPAQSPYPPAQSPYPQSQTPFLQTQKSYPSLQASYAQGQTTAQQFPSQEPIQSHAQVPPQSQPQPQPQPLTQPQTQAQPQPQSQSQASPQPQQGPPYVYDPNATYEDPNVQAWAQYYAQGGTDPQGAVYFISVPGVTDTVEGGGQGGSQGQAGQGQEQGQQTSTITASPTHFSQQPAQYVGSGIGATGAPSSPQGTNHTAQQPEQPQQQPYGYASPLSQPQSQSPHNYTPPGAVGYTSSPGSAAMQGPPSTVAGGYQPPTSGPGYGNGGYDYGVRTMQQQFGDMTVGGGMMHQAPAASS